MSIVEQLHAAHKARRQKWDAQSVKVIRQDKTRPYAPAPIRDDLLALNAESAMLNETYAKVAEENLKLSLAIEERKQLFLEYERVERASAKINQKPIQAAKIRKILALVSRHTGLAVVAIVSPRRHDELIRARYAVYHLACELTSSSLTAIGKRIGGRDHTTIMSGLKRAEYMLATDPEFRAMVDHIKKQFAGDE